MKLGVSERVDLAVGGVPVFSSGLLSLFSYLPDGSAVRGVGEASPVPGQ